MQNKIARAKTQCKNKQKNAKKMQGQKHNAKKNANYKRKCHGKNTVQKKTNEQCKKKQVQKHNAKQCKSKMQKMQAHTKKADVKTAKKQVWTPRNTKEERPIKVNVENDKQSKT